MAECNVENLYEYKAVYIGFVLENTGKIRAVDIFGFVKWGGKYANRLAFG